MKRTIFGLFFLATLIVTVAPVLAQQASQNIPVLPVIAEGDDPNWNLIGDGYLQRQVEPTIAVSTRNPDHLLAFFNDYRAVDIPDDVGLGEETQTAALLLETMDIMMAGLFTLPEIPSIISTPVAAAEAWVGGSRSYNGGLTWSGMFMPGGPFDHSPASQASPIYGEFDAATDPVAVAGPCGYVYVVFGAFNRGGASKMMVARFQDLNNEEGGDTWEYQGMTVVDVGNNAHYGHFLDKPNINIDVLRQAITKKKPKPSGPPSDDLCAHRVYVTYSTFTGKPKPDKFQSQVHFAVSDDYGQSFSKKKINKNFGQNQGTVIAVDPRPGTPETGGGGTVYVFWRHFNSPNNIIMTKSTDYGSSWTRPKKIIGPTPMASYDQPTISTEYNDPSLLTFRSNAFPTAAVTPEGPEGTVFVAWQERVNISKNSSVLGYPDPDGSPRIVMMLSKDGGDSWSDIDGNPDERMAVDFGDRDGDTVPPPGFGALPDERASGPQVMPWLSFGGGRLAMVYYESRGLLSPPGGTSDIGIQDLDLSGLDFISGIDRLVDVRAALLDPATGIMAGTTQVSRYPISAYANLSDPGEEVADIAPVQPKVCKNNPSAEACQPSLNFMNKPQSGSGGSPFMGDYVGLTPIVPFLYDSSTEAWRWAIGKADVPYQGFHTVFADNRHLVPPTFPGLGEEEWQRYQFYGPPKIGGECFNPGSRNTDVLTARIDAELIVSTPTTYKQLDARRGFPIRVQNGTGVDRYYRLTITLGADAASFSADPPTNIDTGDIQVYPYSSVSQVVYVDAGAAGPIRVDVVEIAGLGGSPNGGAEGSVTFNPDPENPDVGGLGDESEQNPFVLNPFVLNPFVLNQTATNTSPSNPFVLNPFVLNNSIPESSVHDVIDTTWEVGTEVGTGTTGVYFPVINIDNADQFVDNYAFQLIVYKTSTFAGFDEACQAYAIFQDQILSNVTNDPANPFVLNPFVLNPFVLNGNPENPFVLNPFVLNSGFAIPPPDPSTKRGAVSKGLKIAGDGTLRAPLEPDVIKMTLRAYQLKPLCDAGQSGPNCISYRYDPNIDTASAAVGSGDCVQKALANGDATAAAACFKFYAPDLVPELIDPEANEEIVEQSPGSFDFPDGGWNLVNQGTADATAENRPLRNGFYLTTENTVEFNPDGSPVPPAILVGVQQTGVAGTTVDVDESVLHGPAQITIPAGLPADTYNLVLYVDDLEEVSEFDEINNKLTTVVPITVEPAPVIINLVENGSFDGPEVTNASGWQLFTEDEIDSWSLEWVGCEGCPEGALLELQVDGKIMDTADGGQYAELDSDWGTSTGNPSSLRIYQVIDTQPGACYTLSYSWARRTSNDQMVVTWGLEEEWEDEWIGGDTWGGGDFNPADFFVAVHPGENSVNNQQWYQNSLTLYAYDETMRLEFIEIGPPDSYGMFLDSVLLQPLPTCPEVIENPDAG